MCGCNSSRSVRSEAIKPQTVQRQTVVTNLKSSVAPQKLEVIRKSSVTKCPKCGYPMATVTTSKARLICTNCRYTQ